MPRILIVDDSNLMRRVLASVVAAMDRFEVTEVATSAEEAEAKIDRSPPDVIVLDVNLPGMDGFTFLSRLRQRYRTPVILVSAQALDDIVRERGRPPDPSCSFIEKPDGVSRTLDDFRRELGARLALVAATGGSPPPVAASVPAEPLAVRPALRPGRFGLIAVGASTGGVDALAGLLSAMPRPLPPVLITLHMPAAYTARFALRLAAVTGHTVVEAQDGEILGAGQVRVAPGGLHLSVERCGGLTVARRSDGPLVSGHKPSVDVLFHSAATAFGRSAIGVILTGMGRDGADGLLAMRRAGATTFGQAGESCIVYGMPKAARDLGAVEHELPLDELGRAIMRVLGN
jgi:two-component system chemotaxis response regulator CheB